MDPNQREPDAPLQKLKVMLIGDVSVGKTSFLTRYVKNIFKKGEMATIGVEYTTTTILKDGTNTKIVIWDTAGSEKYVSLTTAHYRESHGALLFFDLTDRGTFEHLLFWLSKIADCAEEDTTVMLIGSKCDIVEEDSSARQVSVEEAQEFARKYGLLYFETSAKTGANVREAFSELLESIHDVQKKTTSRDKKEKQKEHLLKLKIEKNFGKSEDDGTIQNESIRANRCCC